MLIGLTGGVATGKSRVSDWFAGHGWFVICTDRVVHELYEPGQPLPAELAREFGADILTAEGRIDRQRLGGKVFGNSKALKQLNAMVHPRVREVWQERASAPLKSGTPVMVVVPLLYEAGYEKDFEQVWVVACSAATQKQRLGERGIALNEIDKRLSAQWLLQKKIDLADRMIWNDADWARTEEQLESILESLSAAKS
jgi:dephospho-CoA kinase